jgi:hypothetical protein
MTISIINRRVVRLASEITVRSRALDATKVEGHLRPAWSPTRQTAYVLFHRKLLRRVRDSGVGGETNEE